jgi:Flp pilus assembly protein TadD
MSESSRKRLAAGLVLAFATLVAYGPVLRNDFVVYDDRTYVLENPHVQAGLSGAGFVWAWTATRASNWHPLTWLSHMLDQELYGSDARGHHATSLALHLASTLLLFGCLERATGAVGRSAFAAALFGVHPLHVESVAWVAERKDVLSTLLMLLTLMAYARYARRPGVGRYLAVAGLFALGLAAKPMLVTLPFLMLLLDRWPLGRWSDRTARELLLEKVPLVVLALASCAVTVAAQRAGGALGSMDRFPLDVRIGNAILSYVAYLRLMVWPSGLAVFYPHPRAVPLLPVVGSAALLAGVSVWVFRSRARHPYLLVSWLWYLVALLPVIGLVQVGEQALADRYTYVPLIGIFVMLAWGVPDAVRAVRGRSVALTVAAVVVVLALVPLARAQVARWRDSRTLFEHALSVTSGNRVAHNNLGLVLEESGHPEEAIAQFEAALALRADDAAVLNNLGNALADLDRHAAAVERFERAIALQPGHAKAHFNLAASLVRLGRAAEALRHYREAVRLEPDDPRMRNNLGIALAREGDAESAIEQFEAAIRLQPGNGRAHANLAGALVLVGRRAEARVEIENARKAGFEPPESLIQALSE